MESFKQRGYLFCVFIILFLSTSMAQADESGTYYFNVSASKEMLH
ncbi:MAG: hypothetical protein K0R94_1049 [Burkholderiales bacterium]|jgi:hypothetical protein|nr:hypothetical protein [Burkholderiales bacterium]